MHDVSVIGGVQVDLVVTPVTRLPAPGETTFVEQMAVRVGGAGANAALGLTELGFPVRLFGAIGDDVHGRWVLDELARAGLGGDLMVAAGEQTGMTVACEAPAHDRSFLTLLGAADGWDLSHLPASAAASASVLVCDYFCAPLLRGAATGSLLAAARAGGGRTYFDTAWDPEAFPSSSREEVRALLPLADVFLPNEAEACAIAGESDPRAAARALQRVSGGWVVVKRGPDGCDAAGPDGAELREPAPVVDVADTTGAGDAFNAGLVGALAGGAEWPAALRAATQLASTVVARPSADRYAARPARGWDVARRTG